MKLAEMQRDFQSWLVEASEAAADRLSVHGASGLAVYQNNYRAQLISCLEHAFPLLRRWLGEEEFRHAAIAHISACPPSAWTLDAYAEGFNETLSTRFPHNPDLHELAWVELALGEAFVAEDATPFTSQDFATVDWDSAWLRLTPSLRLREITTNVEPIWTALCEQKEPPQSEILARPCGMVVWRRGFTSRLREIDALECDALVHLRDNGSFAGLCQRLVEEMGESEGIAKAGEWLAGWLGNEWVIGVEAPARHDALTRGDLCDVLSPCDGISDQRNGGCERGPISLPALGSAPVR